MKISRLMQSPKVQNVTKFVIDGQELSDISEHLNKEVIAFGVRGNTLIIKTGD